LPETLIFDGINRFFWTLAIFTLYLCAFYYLSHGLKKEKRDDKLIIIGFFCIFLGFAFARLFYFIAEYQLKGTYRGHVFYSDYSNIYEYYTFFGIIAPISSILGITVFLFIFDNVMKKTKYMPFILNVLFITLIIFVSEFRGTIIYIAVAYNGTIMLLILFWFSNHSSKEVQIISTLMIIGSILIIFGTILDTRYIKSLNLIPPTIPSFFLIAGGIVSISPMFFEFKPQKSISKVLIFLIVLLIVNVLIIIFSVSFILLVSEDPSQFIPIIGAWGLLIEAIIVLLYVLYRIKKLLRPSSIIPIEKEINKEKDVLSIFSRPERITAEEVSISKEKRICLVCKNTLAKDIYLCPTCYAFYCKDCSTVLSNKENACWVCNTPFDDSKPVTILDFAIEDEEKHKMKKLALITVIDTKIYDQIEKFNWIGTEKEEFIQYMLSISAERRKQVLKEMMEIIGTLNEGGSKENGGL